ncbi:MAG TPA: heme ABC transporter ATP-binding protein [Thiomicrospira sp.]|nr:heme ABC transporter ATP-binding protein [Thiomicrospira sp.]
MLQVSHLSITLQDKKILSDINLSIEPGSVVSILGPNGAGKSTLLKSMSGDFKQALTNVTIAGCPLNEIGSKKLAKIRAVMPQSIQLDFPFLVSEIIEMSLLESSSLQERQQYIAQALALFDVEELHDRNYLTLSGGEQQRVQLARVVAQIVLNHSNQPRYLFLDECTASLDIAHQHQVFKVVSRVVKQHNVAAIMVLHDLNLASQYSDNLLLMKDGVIVEQGKVLDVLTADNITKVYGYPVTMISHPDGWPIVIPAPKS